MELRKKIRKLASSERRRVLKSFFKCGEGQYSACDEFFGISVPVLRNLLPLCESFRFSELNQLLNSHFHEERLLAILVLVNQFEKSGSSQQKIIFDFYLKRREAVNNWDLVDLSAHKIVGAFLENKSKKILFKLAKSKVLWDRRMAIVATWHLIRQGKTETTFQLVEKLMNDKEDLMHKACGWMLREAGKQNITHLEKFLDQWGGKMPRTMLRYAIEKFPERKRQKYLKIKPIKN